MDYRIYRRSDMPQKSDADHKSRAELPDVKLQKKTKSKP